MTNREGAIITAFTQISFGGPHFNHFHKYAEEKFGRPVFTHEMASIKFWDKLKELSSADFEELDKNLKDDI